MHRSSRPRLLRATAIALALTFSSATTAACGSDVVDDGVEQDVEEGVDDAEQEMEENTEDDEG